MDACRTLAQEEIHLHPAGKKGVVEQQQSCLARVRRYQYVVPSRIGKTTSPTCICTLESDCIIINQHMMKIRPFCKFVDVAEPHTYAICEATNTDMIQGKFRHFLILNANSRRRVPEKPTIPKPTSPRGRGGCIVERHADAIARVSECPTLAVNSHERTVDDDGGEVGIVTCGDLYDTHCTQTVCRGEMGQLRHEGVDLRSHVAATGGSIEDIIQVADGHIARYRIATERSR